MWSRYLEAPLKKHLSSWRQMVFLVGPRQVGKTTLAQGFLHPLRTGVNYFNWDDPAHRRILLKEVFIGKTSFTEPEQNILVFDEIHKYPRWKNTLKGLFDHHEPHTHWIITGSAALNVYRKGQDSLLGRHFTYYLSPLSVAELLAKQGEVVPFSKLLETSFQKSAERTQQILNDLLQFGGFPEPFSRKENSFLTQWRNNRLDRLINQDLAAIENLKHLALVENLVLLLPERVGSPLSVNSLREDLEVHFATVKHWLELLTRVFYGFFVRPYSGKVSRMLKKEAKWYLWDWTEVEEEGFRFENLVAVHLLKYIHFVNDLGLGELSLHYLRDKEKREVDFVICEKRKPRLVLECKVKETEPSPALFYFMEKLNINSGFQIVKESIEPKRFAKGEMSIDVVSAASFLEHLV